MTHPRKKPIGVALPLQAIIDTSACDKMPVRNAARSVRPDWEEETQ